MNPPNPPLDTRTLPYSEAAIAEAAALIVAGGVVAVPTETVYGLAADATESRAVAGVYAAKGRPSFNPLIVHVLDRAAAERIATFDHAAAVLADAFWPGPLTLVLPLRRLQARHTARYGWRKAGLAGSSRAAIARPTAKREPP